MADDQRKLFLFLVLVSCFTYSSYAYQFLVGGRDGWVLHPSESYSHWAGRLRFLVNDTLLFRYTQGSDSVLFVNGVDYNSCNINNPIQSFTDGNSVFRFDRSGPFFFISGNKTNCDNGQKLHIIVLAIRNPPVMPPSVPPPAAGSSPPPATAPSSSSPSPSPPAPSPSSPPAPSPSSPPAPSPSSTSPSPPAQSPSSTSTSPSPSPLAPSSSSPSPSSAPPAPSSSSSPSPSPLAPSSSFPTPSPSPPAPSSSSSPSPSPSSVTEAPSPAANGPSTVSGSPATSPLGSEAPNSGNTQAGANAPPPGRSFASRALSSSVVFVSVVSVVLSMGVGGFISYV